MEEFSPSARSDRYGKKINRDHSPVLIHGIPWLTVILGSFTPILPLIAAAPILPPIGLLFMIAWRLLRPGLLPLWAGFPFGLIDDLYSGQPFGSGILLFSCALIALDLMENRFPWRNFWQNWMTASLVLAPYLLVAAILSGSSPSLALFAVTLPQILLSILLFPIIISIAALLDRIRLLRVRRIG